MTAINQRPLRDDLPFGARISGVNRDSLKDEAVRKQILDVFEDRGMIVFEGMEPSGEMQLALSGVFGPLQDHAMRAVPRVNQDAMPGVIDLNFNPSETDILEVNGRQVIGWVPWHYDACYTAKLNRGGILRALEIPPEGGMTGFADGVQLYNAISPELRARFEDQRILYHPKLLFMHQRFGMPKQYRVIRLQQATLNVIEQAEGQPRSLHPAIWQRKTGEKVLHVSPWQAAGMEGHEDPKGDELLEALCQEIYAKMTPYWHKWTPTDMVAWDNWRFVHAISGHDPGYARRVHRTTIKGDYGLGCFEKDATADKPLQMSA